MTDLETRTRFSRTPTNPGHVRPGCRRRTADARCPCHFPFPAMTTNIHGSGAPVMSARIRGHARRYGGGDGGSLRAGRADRRACRTRGHPVGLAVWGGHRIRSDHRRLAARPPRSPDRMGDCAPGRCPGGRGSSRTRIWRWRAHRIPSYEHLEYRRLPRPEPYRTAVRAPRRVAMRYRRAATGTESWAVRLAGLTR